jgi:hypothetical protein
MNFKFLSTAFQRHLSEVHRKLSQKQRKYALIRVRTLIKDPTKRARWGAKKLSNIAKEETFSRITLIYTKSSARRRISLYSMVKNFAH